MRILIPTIVSLFLVACATKHPGNKGTALTAPTKNLFVVSAKAIDPSNKETFELIEISIENKSDEWVRFKDSSVVLGGGNLTVPVGRDLRDWAKAMYYQKKINEHNEQLAIGAVAVGGAAVAAGGNSNGNSGLATAGAFAVMGAYSWAIVDAINSTYSNVQGVGENTPENHLLTPFGIPGKMFTRKWVLIKKPVGVYLETLVFELVDEENQKYTYQVKI